MLDTGAPDFDPPWTVSVWYQAPWRLRRLRRLRPHPGARAALERGHDRNGNQTAWSGIVFTRAHAPEEFDGWTAIGRDPAGVLRHFQGEIDVVRIYPMALTPADVAALYASP